MLGMGQHLQCMHEGGTFRSPPIPPCLFGYRTWMHAMSVMS